MRLTSMPIPICTGTRHVRNLDLTFHGVGSGSGEMGRFGGFCPSLTMRSFCRCSQAGRHVTIFRFTHRQLSPAAAAGRPTGFNPSAKNSAELCWKVPKAMLCSLGIGTSQDTVHDSNGESLNGRLRYSIPSDGMATNLSHGHHGAGQCGKRRCWGRR